MKRTSLTFQVFISILLVALGTALTVGLFARFALSAAFDRYLAGIPTPGTGGRPRMGRMMLGAAEQSFITSVDKSVYLAALIAVAVATLVAVLLAAYLSRPLRRLETAADGLSKGELTHRVTVQGPFEVARLGDAFNRMADSLEEAEGLRRRLVADVAHELRNPLAAARAQAEGMAEGVIVADQARLESVVDDLVHLSALVEDLQELAIAEAGHLSYQMAPTDLAEITRGELARAAEMAPDGVAVEPLSDSVSAPILADERRLAQVLRNLLSNAVRHTASGSIGVTIATGPGEVRLKVTDTGEGIPTEELPHIFERFFRADSARASDTGGAGLGLAISRSIIRDHGGDMFAESELGVGTTVGFFLPYTAARALHDI